MIKAVIFDLFETLITHYNSPLYFGREMAKDAGIPEEAFQKKWRATEDDRSIGKVTFEEVVEHILREHNCYTKEKLEKITKKRVNTKEECFRNLHPEILLMLDWLKEKGYLIALISNCFSEEAGVVQKSILAPYFDAMFLSCKEGVQKPDFEIFHRCIRELKVEPHQCLYIGDGGSRELEAAKEIGMYTAQAVWYLKEGTMQPTGRKNDFLQLEHPMNLEKILWTIGRNFFTSIV